MSDDPVSQPPPASSDGVMSEVSNRPKPSADLSESASLPAEAQAKEGTQPVQAQPSTPQASAVIEQPQPSQPPSEEPTSIPTTPQTEPPISTPPAQTVLPQTEAENRESQTVQANTEPQSNPAPEALQPQIQEATPSASVIEPSLAPNPSPPSLSSIPSLHFPFYGRYSISFDFGAVSTDETIQKKYQEWGIVGHDGLDFGLPEGTEVLSCDEGVVTQAGDNGDFGISITIKHSWGTSIYCHLQSFGVLVNDHVSKGHVIGASDQTGFAKAPHLHFGIQPNNPDTNNGYLGYINPAPYLMEKTEKPQPQSEIQPQSPEEKQPDLSEEKSEESVISPPSSQEPQPPVSPESQLPQSPLPAEVSTEAGVSPQAPQVPQVTQPEITEAEIQRLAEEKVKAQWQQYQPKGNPAKQAEKEASLQKVFIFAQEKKRITNAQVRDLLHISQSTATHYLSALVQRGMLRVEGKGKATVYLY